MTRLILTACAALLAAPAMAQTLCGERAALVERLTDHYGEARQAAGLVSETVMVEIWASPETGTFTVLRTLSDGRSCIVAVGEAWRLVPQEPEGEPS